MNLLYLVDALACIAEILTAAATLNPDGRSKRPTPTPCSWSSPRQGRIRSNYSFTSTESSELRLNVFRATTSLNAETRLWPGAPLHPLRIQSRGRR